MNKIELIKKFLKKDLTKTLRKNQVNVYLLNTVLRSK